MEELNSLNQLSPPSYSGGILGKFAGSVQKLSLTQVARDYTSVDTSTARSYP
jgi:hypothetical protein